MENEFRIIGKWCIIIICASAPITVQQAMGDWGLLLLCPVCGYAGYCFMKLRDCEEK